jgi:CubicO group peptidase (beta-lactamase class C family)
MDSLTRTDPAALGFDPKRLADAVAFAEANESPFPRSMVLPDGRYVMTADSGEAPPDDEVLGPVTPRGGPAGIILRHGQPVAEWGDTNRADVTFSVAKSFLALLAGIALGDGLIRSLDDRVAGYALDDGFTSAQNRDITWRQLLQQTSEWEGAVFGKADRIDRNRRVGQPTDGPPKGSFRALQAPGTFWEYNDVRVNRLALSLLHVFREELPAVFKRRILDPIGGSPDWRWDGYRNSTVEIDGRKLVSVPGGSHWGGGVLISARDQARIGLLVSRDGVCNGRRLLPEGWCAELRKPCAIMPSYGLMWWLNSGRAQLPAAPESSWFAMGWGTHVIWIEPEHDLVVVIRWIARTQLGSLVERILASVK